MIKIFNAGKIKCNENFEDKVNEFLEYFDSIKQEYKLHVSCTDDYTVIVVEYHP